MNIRGLITVGMISFCIIAGRASFLLYSAYETARLEMQQHAIAQDINHPSIKMHWIGSSLVMEGMVENQGEKIRAEQIALAHLSQFHVSNVFRAPKIVNALTVSTGVQASSDGADDQVLAADVD